MKNKMEIIFVEDKKLGCKLLFDQIYNAYNYCCEEPNSRKITIASFGENYELQFSELLQSDVDRFTLESRRAS